MFKCLIAVLFLSGVVSANAAPEITDSDVIEKAKQYEMNCNEGVEVQVQKISHSYSYSYEKATAPKHKADFYIVTCPAGAYNMASVLLYADSGSGLTVVPLTSPLVNAKNQRVIGWRSQIVVGYLAYDDKKNILVSYSRGGGVGDLSEVATYSILEDMVLLRKYELDNTEDGKIAPKVIFVSKEPLKR